MMITWFLKHPKNIYTSFQLGATLWKLLDCITFVAIISSPSADTVTNRTSIFLFETHPVAFAASSPYMSTDATVVTSPTQVAVASAVPTMTITNIGIATIAALRFH